MDVEESISRHFISPNKSEKEALSKIERTDRFVFWSKREPTGKTASTIEMALEYARLFPEKKIVVIDLSSSTSITHHFVQDNIGPKCPTMMDYFKDFIIASSKGDSYPIRLVDYMIHVKFYNRRMPDNIMLCAGNQDLGALNDEMYSIFEKNMSTANIKSQIETIGLCLYKSIESLVEEHKDQEYEFFIDTDSLCTIFTTIGILAANVWMLPYTVNDNVLLDIKSSLFFVYGPSIDPVALCNRRGIEKVKLPIPRLLLKPTIDRYTTEKVINGIIIKLLDLKKVDEGM